MFDISFGELLLILVVALVVLGPEKLPVLAHKIGRFTQKIKQYQWDFQRQFQKLEQLHDINNIKEIQELKSGFDDFTSYHSYNSALPQAVPSYYPRKLKKNLAIRMSPALMNRIKRHGTISLKRLRK